MGIEKVLRVSLAFALGFQAMAGDAGRAWAEDAAPAPAAEVAPTPGDASTSADAGASDAPVSSETGRRSSSGSKSTKGKRYREKEAEGSEAPDRFEANTVIKSRYTVDGKALEVDPD